jgi:hypothetical protein
MMQGKDSTNDPSPPDEAAYDLLSMSNLISNPNNICEQSLPEQSLYDDDLSNLSNLPQSSHTLNLYLADGSILADPDTSVLYDAYDSMQAQERHEMYPRGPKKYMRHQEICPYADCTETLKIQPGFIKRTKMRWKCANNHWFMNLHPNDYPGTLEQWRNSLLPCRPPERRNKPNGCGICGHPCKTDPNHAAFCKQMQTNFQLEYFKRQPLEIRSKIITQNNSMETISTGTKRPFQLVSTEEPSDHDHNHEIFESSEEDNHKILASSEEDTFLMPNTLVKCQNKFGFISVSRIIHQIIKYLFHELPFTTYDDGEWHTDVEQVFYPLVETTEPSKDSTFGFALTYKNKYIIANPFTYAYSYKYYHPKDLQRYIHDLQHNHITPPPFNGLKMMGRKATSRTPKIGDTRINRAGEQETYLSDPNSDSPKWHTTMK